MLTSADYRGSGGCSMRSTVSAMRRHGVFGHRFPDRSDQVAMHRFRFVATGSENPGPVFLDVLGNADHRSETGRETWYVTCTARSQSAGEDEQRGAESGAVRDSHLARAVAHDAVSESGRILRGRTPLRSCPDSAGAGRRRPLAPAPRRNHRRMFIAGRWRLLHVSRISR